MKTLLLSTTSGWNCGDDFIRWGLLRALNLRPDVRVLWWNRGYGIEASYANDLDVNLPLADAIIMAGTPEWGARNERLYRHALETDTPIYLLGVGKHGGIDDHADLFGSVVDAGLIRLAIARDTMAHETLACYGVDADVLCDPAFYMDPLPGGDVAIVGWRLVGRPANPRQSEVLDGLLYDSWSRLDGPKVVVVHDNREVAPAEELFGAESVYYATDPRDLLDVYARCRYYVGARIHGAVPSLLAGAPAHLYYQSNKAECVEVARDRLGITDAVEVTYLDDPVEPNLNLAQPSGIARASRAEAEQLQAAARDSGLGGFVR